MEELTLRKLVAEKFPKLASEENMTVILGEINEMDAEFRAHLEYFLETSEIPAISVGGYSIPRLMDEYGMNPMSALFTLDWLKRDPERARRSLKKSTTAAEYCGENKKHLA